ncbi:uncharacterized protein [Periplaneta americana]|uniref:uncharacterized protein isoform X2 n=1 Tax=Periplaneta americana TaxID=6978 RepID=UPI0037E93EC6
MMFYYSEEYVGQVHADTCEVKSEVYPVPLSSSVLKREPEERNFLDQQVTGIKEEYKEQSHDLTSDIKLEEDPLPISFPMVKREPEEEQSDLVIVKEEPRLEVTVEDDEVFTEREPSFCKSSTSNCNSGTRFSI